jgi:uncharacterized protein (TIGR02147 family)
LLLQSGFPQILEFVDYRIYLRSVYEYFKGQRDRFSFQAYSDLLGLGNRSFIQNIIRRAKDLPLSSVPRIAEGLELNAQDTDYLNLLVQFDLSEDPKEKDELWREIWNRQHRGISKDLEASYLPLFEKWHTFAVRELVGLGISDPKQIAKQILPRISVEAVREDLKLLSRMKLICENEDGTLSVLDAHLRAPDIKNNPLDAQVIRNFQSQMLELARDALAKIAPEDRYVLSGTMTLTEDQFKQLSKMLEQLQQKAVGMAEEAEKMILSGEKADCRVFQLNLNVVPLSTRNED